MQCGGVKVQLIRVPSLIQPLVSAIIHSLSSLAGTGSTIWTLSCLLPEPLYRLGDGNSDMQWYSVYELSLLPSTRAFVWKEQVWPQVQTKLNYRLNWTTNAGVELRIWLKQGKEKRLPTRKKDSWQGFWQKRVNVFCDKMRQDYA